MLIVTRSTTHYYFIKQDEATLMFQQENVFVKGFNSKRLLYKYKVGSKTYLSILHLRQEKKRLPPQPKFLQQFICKKIHTVMKLMHSSFHLGSQNILRKQSAYIGTLVFKFNTFIKNIQIINRFIRSKLVVHVKYIDMKL